MKRQPLARLALSAFLTFALVAGATAQDCGDCNQDGTVTILDALRQAQVGVGTVIPTLPGDLLTCDVDSDSAIGVLDALRVAQFSAGLGVSVSCPAQPSVSATEALTGPTLGLPRVPIAGGETVQVIGDGFLAGATVTVLGSVLPTIYFDAQTITFIAPSTTADVHADVTVTNPGGFAATLIGGLFFTQELSLDPAPDTLSSAHAHHLMRRAGFGGNTLQINAAITSGLAATVNSLINYTNDPAVELAAETIYGGTLPPRPSLNDRTNKEWWIHMMVKNPNPFQERLAWLLHDHFAISERVFSSEARWTMYPYVNLMRRFSMTPGDSLSNGLPGLDYDWKRLLIEMTKDEAMLEWLNGRTSTAGAPNENYARELWELFSLGEGIGYTENDIREAAKAFTGFFWFASGGTGTTTALVERYRPSRHHTGIKTIFGVPGRYGYDDLSPFYETSTGPAGMPELGTVDPSILTDPVDLDGGVVELTLSERPLEASRFVCRKLCDFFIYDDLHDSVVDALAADLRAPGSMQWNLRPIIQRILLSKAMFSERAIKGKYAEPVDFVIGFLRMTGIDLSPTLTTNANRIRTRLVAMDQVVLDPPDVAGWPHGASWATQQGLLERFNFLTYTVEQQDLISQILPLTPAVRASITPASLVDHISNLLDVTLSANARQIAIDYVSTDYVGGVVVPLVFNPLNDTHLRVKTRGLLWLIGQNNDAHAF